MNLPAKLLFASNNPNKVEEVREILPAGYDLIGLKDINWTLEIPEPFDTFEDNAKAKASFVFDHTGLACFADDSGLEIDALDGRPGVWSAMYAGDHRNSEDNVNKVLAELGDSTNRSARFIAVIAFQIDHEKIFLFKGIVEGAISKTPLGKGGFGYDPVFIPSGFDQTFGQLSPSVKNRISHRALAMRQFIRFIQTNK